MDRRHVLGLTAAALGSLAGCASVASEVANRPGNATNGHASDPAHASDASNGSGAALSGNASVSNASVSDAASGGNVSGTSGSPPTQFPVHAKGGPVANAPLPRNAASDTYATMGSANPDAKAVLYGNWKCPYTRDFVLTDFQTVVTDYVETGKLSVTYRALSYYGGKPFLGPDAPRAARAGLAVWNRDPRHFWPYFVTAFASQPQERFAWATADQLERIAETAGVRNPPGVRRDVSEGLYGSAVQATTTAAVQAGVSSVPRLVVDGTSTAPTQDFNHTLSVIEHAIG